MRKKRKSNFIVTFITFNVTFCIEVSIHCPQELNRVLRRLGERIENAKDVSERGTKTEMNKAQKTLRERIQKAQEIYYSFLKEYNAIPQEERWKFSFKARVCVKIQTELVVSERKAKEYVKLVENASRFLPVQQNT